MKTLNIGLELGPDGIFKPVGPGDNCSVVVERNGPEGLVAKVYFAGDIQASLIIDTDVTRVLSYTILNLQPTEQLFASIENIAQYVNQHIGELLC